MVYDRNETPLINNLRSYDAIREHENKITQFRSEILKPCNHENVEALASKIRLEYIHKFQIDKFTFNTDFYDNGDYSFIACDSFIE